MSRITLISAILILTIASAVSADQPKVNGYVQVLGQANSQLSIQRSEIIIASADSLKSGYLLIINFYTAAQPLNNAIVWYRLPHFSFVPASKLTAGKWKPPFGRHWPLPPLKISTVDYFSLSRSTLISRDMGIIWETGAKLWQLSTAIFNGVEATGNLGKDNNHLKDFYGRFTFKPKPNLELGFSQRYGQPASPDKLKRVWGADCQYTFKNVQAIGEFIHSMQNDKVIGWDLMAIAKVWPNLEAVLWYEDIDNRTTNSYQDIVGAGVNWYFQPNRKLAVNYVDQAGRSHGPDQFLVQLQASF